MSTQQQREEIVDQLRKISAFLGPDSAHTLGRAAQMILGCPNHPPSPMEIILPEHRVSALYNALYYAKDRLGNYQLVGRFDDNYSFSSGMIAPTELTVPALHITISDKFDKSLHVRHCGNFEHHHTHTFREANADYRCVGINKT